MTFLFNGMDSRISGVPIHGQGILPSMAEDVIFPAFDTNFMESWVRESRRGCDTGERLSGLNLHISACAHPRVLLYSLFC